MAFTNETTHYGLPQWIGSDKPTYLVDQNNAFQKIDSEIYNANVAAGQAVTTAEGAVSTAGSAASSAAEALSTAQTASSTAADALSEAQTANTNAQAAQTAAGAAQTAAEAAQTAAAGNSITNLAPAYDPTITYNVGDLVTAEGKLYKCIVAVTTPMEFDINFWDDVSTSEVYYTKSQADDKFVIRNENLSQSVNLIDTTTSEINFTSVNSNIAIGDNNLMNIHFNASCSEVVSGHSFVTIGVMQRVHNKEQYGYALLEYPNYKSEVVMARIAANGQVSFKNANDTDTLNAINLNFTCFI